MAKKKRSLAEHHAARNNTHTSDTPSASTYADEVNEFVGRCAELEREGMTLFYTPDISTIGTCIPATMEEHYGCGGGGGECLDGFGPISVKGNRLFAASYSVIPMPEGEGAIPWGGARNRMPLDIYNTCKDLIYSAAGLRYNFELMEGLGPKVVYKYLDIKNGVPEECTVPFEYAGVLLLERIKRLKKEKEASGEETPPTESNADGTVLMDLGNARNSNGISEMEKALQKGCRTADMQEYRRKAEPAPAFVPSIDYDRLGTIDYELEQAKRDYEEWALAWHEMEEWLERNNLSDIYKNFIQDNIVTDLAFMRFNLNAEMGTDKNGKKVWCPKIVNIDNMPVVCSRYEKRDKLGNINHAYYNEEWRESIVDRLGDKQEAVMYPLIGNKRMSSDGSRAFAPQLREYIAKPEFDLNGVKKEWLCSPIAFPSCENAYYTRPSFWSLYASLVVTYASTYFFDKAVARANATQLRYAIYINLNWLERIRSQQEEAIANGDKVKVEDFRQKVINSINSFIRNKSNNGKSLTGDVFIDDKGQEHKAFEIVAIPTPKIETASSEELGNISNIFSMAMGIHGALQGDRPGKQSSSSGGTFQRELHLLAQGKMSPRQRLWCDWIEGVLKFNKWCPKHVGVVIKMPILTTLDRNKTGIEEEER